MTVPKTQSHLNRQALYHREYYLNDCEGFREFLKSRGARLSRRLAKCLALAGPEPRELILDLGCGRGELALHLAKRGARVLAMDPSRDSLGLTRETLATVRENALPVGAIGEALPLKTGDIETVILSDVVEHVTRERLPGLLSECLRVLKPGGRVIVHTQPNATLLRFTVPLLSRLSFLWGVKLPRDLRLEMTPGAGPEYHPSEQSRRSLRKALRGAGFTIEELWLEGTYPIHRIFGECRFKQPLIRWFRRQECLKDLLASQLFAVARKPG